VRLFTGRSTLLGLAELAGTSLSELTIISEAANFVFEANAQLPSLPIYLRPRSYAAVDAVLVTDTVIWLIHTSVSDRYSPVFRKLLLILQLEKRGINVQCRVVYCLVGINEKDIQEVARSAVQSLEASLR
jgi:hypothetical protein